MERITIGDHLNLQARAVVEDSHGYYS
jgi:hypothetical protein